MSDYSELPSFEPISSLSPIRDDQQVLLSRFTTTHEQKSAAIRHALELMAPASLTMAQMRIEFSRGGPLVLFVEAHPEHVAGKKIMVADKTFMRALNGAEVHETIETEWRTLHDEVRQMVADGIL